MNPFFCSLLTLCLLLAAAPPSPAAEAGRPGTRLLGDGPHYLNLAVGTFEILDDHDATLNGQVEFRFGRKLAFIGPLAGILANLDGCVTGYAGIYLDLALGVFVLSPQTGISVYEKGNSKNLGGPFEFISGIGLSYEFANRSRLGLRYQHISNADLYDTNPGADILLLNYGIAF